MMKMTKKMIIVAACVIAMVGVMLKLTTHSTAEAEMTGHYYDLSYKEQGTDDDPELLCVELAAEGECDFKANTAYEISFDLPEILLEEMQQARRGEYDIKLAYIDQVEAGGYGYIRFTIVNTRTKQMYMAHSGFGAEEGLYLQHQVRGTGLSEDGKTIRLVLETSTIPGNGAFQTTFSDATGEWRILRCAEMEEF